MAQEFASSLKDNYESNIHEIILFGSVARGDDGIDSDIDMIVVCNSDRFQLRRKIMKDVIKFLLKHGVYISVKTLTKDIKEDLRDSGFLQTVSKEGILIG